MLEFIKRFFELRRRRSESRQLLAQHGLAVKGSGFRCHLCGEETVGLHRTVSRTSLAGEKFCWLGSAVAHACLRCQAVASHADISGFPQHPLAAWRPPNNSPARLW